MDTRCSIAVLHFGCEANRRSRPRPCPNTSELDWSWRPSCVESCVYARSADGQRPGTSHMRFQSACTHSRRPTNKGYGGLVKRKADMSEKWPYSPSTFFPSRRWVRMRSATSSSLFGSRMSLHVSRLTPKFHAPGLSLHVICNMRSVTSLYALQNRSNGFRTKENRNGCPWLAFSLVCAAQASCMFP